LFTFYAARLKNFSISEADAERERNVVRQEHDYRVGSQPFARFARRLDRLLLPDHPAGQWTIGLPEDIAALKLEDARVFHRNWYVLNNVYFVVKATSRPQTWEGDGRTRRHRGAALPPGGWSRSSRRLWRSAPTFASRTLPSSGPGSISRSLCTSRRAQTISPARRGSLVTSFLQSRLPGSVYDAPIEQDKLRSRRRLDLSEPDCAQTVTLSISTQVAPDVAPEALLAGISNYVEKLAFNGIPADAIERLKKRSVESSAMADKDPRRVYGRLVSCSPAATVTRELARWPERIGAVSPEHVDAMVKGLAGPGRRDRDARAGGRTPMSPRSLARAALGFAARPFCPDRARHRARLAQAATRCRTTPQGIAFPPCALPDEPDQVLHFAWRDGTAATLAGQEAVASLGTR
jgi:hypothetical protein